MSPISVRMCFRIAMAATLAAGVVYAAHNTKWVVLRDGLTFDKLFGALGALFLLVLLIERATEVILAVMGLGSDVQQRRVQRLAIQLDAAPTQELVGEMARELARRDDERERTKAVAMLIGTVLSVIACAGGVGIVSVMFDVPPKTGTGAAPAPSCELLRAVDTLLTTGLLAGGSDSFHQLVRHLEDFFKGKCKP